MKPKFKGYCPIPPLYRYTRNEGIYQLRLKGLTFKVIAKKYRMTLERARQIFYKHSRIKYSEETRNRIWGKVEGEKK